MDFIEVFERLGQTLNYKSVLILDQWESLRVVQNFTKPNDFILMTNFKHLDYWIIGNAILIEETFYEIDGVKSEEDGLKVTGKSMSQKLSQRVIRQEYLRNSVKPERAAYDIVARNLNYNPYGDPIVQIAEPVEFSNYFIRYQAHYKETLEVLIELCETHSFGYFEKPIWANIVSCMINLSKGRDLSDKVVFSMQNENLLSEEFEKSDRDKKDYAWVYGEGEGVARKVIAVDQSTHKLDRYELYVDARDIQSEVEDGVFLSDAEYYAMLEERGRQKLAENAPVFSLSGVIDPNSKLFELGKDYWLGDIVTIESQKFNLKTNLQITSIQQTWDSTGYHIDPVFGKESLSLIEKIRRK